MNGVTLDPTVPLTAARWDEAIAVFKSGWHEADYEGCKGTRVERGLERVFRLLDVDLAPKPEPVVDKIHPYPPEPGLEAPRRRCSCPTGDGSLRWPCAEHPPSLVVNPKETLVETVNRLLFKYDNEVHFGVPQVAEQLRQWFNASQGVNR